MPKKYKAYLLVLFFGAFLVSLFSLNQSLWLDEGTTARVIAQFDFVQIIRVFSPTDFHPPLYYLVMKLWSSLFGTSEIALRLPSLWFALGAGYFVYLAGKKLKNEKVGLWAAAFFLFSPLVVYYSQEARMYLMATFLLTAMLYFFLVKRHVLFNLFAFLSFLTFYGSIFMIAAVYLHLLFKKQYKELFLLLPGFLAALLLVSPLLYSQYMNSKVQLALVANWKNVLGTVNLKNLLLFPLKFSVGRISWEPKVFYYATSGVWTALLFWFVAKQMKTKLFFLFATPIVLGLIFSLFSPLLQYFRFLYLIPLMALLLAAGAGKQWQRVIILAGLASFSLIYLFNPSFHRENWKALATKVEGVVYMIPSSADPLKYYDPQITVKDIREVEAIKEEEITVVPYTVEIYGFDYKSALQRANYVQKQAEVLRGVSWETWVKKDSL